MDSSNYDQLCVTSYFTECMDIISSEIIPGSSIEIFKLPLNASPTTVNSPDGSIYNTPFLEYALYPEVGDVLDFSRSYIYVDFDDSFGICVAHNTYSDTYMMIGPPYSGSIGSRVQIGMGGTNAYDDQYNFLHSTLQGAAVNASEAEHSPEFSTIDGFLNRKISPMKIIRIKKTTGIDYSAADKAFVEYTYTINYNFSIDLNRLSILTSNFHFTTIFDGNLTLKYWFDKMLTNWHYMVLPSINSLQNGIDSKQRGTLCVQGANGILSVNPIRWGRKPTPATMSGVYYVDFGDYTEWIPIAAPLSFELNGATSYTVEIADPDGSDLVAKLKNDGSKGYNKFKHGFISIPICFTFSKPSNVTHVFKMNTSAIYQYTMRLKPEALERLHQMFSSTGMIMRPTQQFISAPFVDSTIGPTTTQTQPVQMSVKINANNITHIIISNTINDGLGNACLMNFFRTNYQLLCNGHPVNQIMYNKVDGRAIKDYTNAIYDTDHEEINNDYLYSLQFPSPPNCDNGKAPTSTTYFYDITTGDTDIQDDFMLMKTCNWLSTHQTYFKQPNKFFDVFSTSAPSSFMTGICIAPVTTSQLQIVLIANYQESLNYMNKTSRYAPTKMMGTEDGKPVVTVASDEALTLPSYLDRQCVTWATVLSDCVFSQIYDPNTRRAISVSILPTYPFADGQTS